MSLLIESEKYITDVVNRLGYSIDNVRLEKSKMEEFGDYQINICMKLAGIYKSNPRLIAEQIVSSLDERFINVNIQGPGFINLTFSKEYILNYLNKCVNDFSLFIDKPETSKKVILDYGGANIAKELHVGHLRCNIGEAVRRLLLVFGDEAISDVHWGDWGTPMGLVIREIQELYPDLPYFDPNYEGEYPSESPVTNDDLGVIYPRASQRKKEDPIYAEEAKNFTQRLQAGEKGIRALWKHIINVSEAYCKEVYDYLNCNFNYLYGESDADPYAIPTINYLKDKGVTEMSDGALIMHIKEETDKKEMPPIMLIKSDGAIAYDTTDLATIYQRVKDFNPDKIWYFVDERQRLHFEQVFRGCYKSNLVRDDVDLSFFGFGTINGLDGKPYKTRDGGVMSLKNLINEVYNKIEPKIKEDITGEERIDICNKLTVASLKYADLSPNRQTDYIFDIDKFTSFEGKTGIYAVYTTTRIKSLLNKINIDSDEILDIYNEDMNSILVKLTSLSRILTNCYNEVTLNYICDFIYELSSAYNKFYGSTNINNETDINKKKSYIALSKLVYNTLSKLLDILGIEEVTRM